MQQPRKGWQEIVTKQGLTFPTTDLPDGSATPYWNESAWYEFTQGEVDRLALRGRGRPVDRGAHQRMSEGDSLSEREQAVGLHLRHPLGRDTELLGRAPQQQRVPDRIRGRQHGGGPVHGHAWLAAHTASGWMARTLCGCLAGSSTISGTAPAGVAPANAGLPVNIS